MATKKNKDKAAETNEAGAAKGSSTSANSSPGRPTRDEVLRDDLIGVALKDEGLPGGGTTAEKANRLEAHYEHTWRKEGSKPGEMADCFPPQLDDESYDTREGTLGCFRSSPAALDACPFCGMSETVTTAPEPAKADAPELVAEGGVVKTNAASIRKNKGKKGAATIEAPKLEVAEEEAAETASNPTEPAPVVSDAPALLTSEASEEETTNAEPGATVADLDRQVARVKNAITTAETTNAISFWEQGDALKEIVDKKLWCLVRNDGDGSPVYRSLGEFTANVLDMSQATAYSLKRIAQIFEREQAEALGFTRMKELVQAQDLPRPALDQVIERASKRAANGQFLLSTRELREEIAKEKRLLQGPPSAPTSTTSNAPAASTSPADRDDAEPDEDDNTVEHDEDGVVVDRTADKSKKKAPEPKTMTVTVADNKIVVPMFKKGSSAKRAKKLEDGCHGSFTGTNGIKGKVEIVIGEDAEIEVVISLVRPD